MDKEEDSTGGVQLPNFNAWLASRQKDDAQVMKQMRLLDEEQAARAKKDGGKKDKKDDDP